MVHGNVIMANSEETCYIKSIQMYVGSYKTGKRHGKVENITSMLSADTRRDGQGTVYGKEGVIYSVL